MLIQLACMNYPKNVNFALYLIRMKNPASTANYKSITELNGTHLLDYHNNNYT